jgi:hypothetical protein
MKKLLKVLIISFIVFGVVSTANALQSGYGYAQIDLSSFDYSDGVGVYGRNLGYYSAGYALAGDQDEFSADSYYGHVLNDWATAYTSNSLASTGTLNGNSFSAAAARAGDGYGTYSGAIAGSFVSAYQFYVRDGGDLSISIDYNMSSLIYGDEPGYSAAGAGAILGIYQDGVGEADGEWLSLTGEYGLDFDSLSGTLELTLAGLEAGSMFSIFAGTAAWAHAYAPGDNTAPVPEPATMLLLGTGLVGLAGFGRKKLAKK